MNAPSPAIEKPDGRQSGRTTNLIITAPHGAIFVWPFKESIQYPKAIARQNDRMDLEIIPASQFRTDLIRGRSNVAVVLDHMTELSFDGWEAFRYAKRTQRP